MNPPTGLPQTLGALLASSKHQPRSVKDELRENLIRKLEKKQPLFPGIVGFEDTVAPQVVNAVLSKHNFILLGLRGQAKTRLIRMLATLLDEWVPYIADCEIHDDPRSPICKPCRDKVREMGDNTPIAWLSRDERYVEKLATPDVTIADMIGDIDPIKAARTGETISSELTVHYGLLPRANRGIFAINELPDLAGKIQVGLFNIMQEGDVQIKGYPVRLPLDVMMVFTANPGRLYGARENHHAAEGPHRQRNPHALSRDARSWPCHHRAGGMDPAQESGGAAHSEIHSRSDRAGGVFRARRQARG